MQETGCSNWTLNGGEGPVLDARLAGWLAKVTFALCQAPVPRYLDEKLLCKGAPQQVPHTEEVRYNHEAFGLRDTEGRKRTIVCWHLIPARHERSAVSDCAAAGGLSLPAPGKPQPAEPLWLAGT